MNHSFLALPVGRVGWGYNSNKVMKMNQIQHFIGKENK